jgi:hypothetical protein
VRTEAKDRLEYVWIPAGEFTMGATPGDDETDEGERPAHRVRTSRGFWLGKKPGTVAETFQAGDPRYGECQLERRETVLQVGGRTVTDGGGVRVLGARG